MKNRLLREAIAEAKTIRETAIANARVQLEEAFTPQIASALSAKLRNEIEDVTEQHDLSSSEIGSAGVTVDDPAPKQPSKAASDSSKIDNPKQEFTSKTGAEGPTTKPASVNENDDTDLDDLDGVEGGDVGAAPDPFGAPAGGMDAGMGAGMDAGMDAGMGGDMEGDDLDLEAIIQQLEADVAGGAESIPMEGFEDPMAGVDPRGAAVVGSPTSVRQETVNVGEKDANSASKDGKAPTPTKDGVQGGKEVKPGTPVADHEQLGEELNLEEILREVEAEDDQKPWDSDKIAAENVNLKNELREHRDVVVYLKGKLNEVNMLNTKLLYSNKLFRGFDLTEPQKAKIVKTFDRATTLREVKLIYSTLAESFSGKTSGKSVKKQNTTTITEGLASKPMSSTKPVAAAEVLNESSDADEFRMRMQKLAGIKIL